MTAPAPGEVHVWLVDLSTPESATADLARYLDPTELERAKRFRTAAGRRRQIVAAGALRRVLADYLGLEPGAVGFRVGPCGKPELALQHGVTHLRFNLSHSEDLALVAVADGAPVGVDVERLRIVPRASQLARRYFHEAEIADLETVNGLEPESQAFLRCWSCKEAFVKALGEGLTRPLNTFAVAALTTDPARLLWDGRDPTSPAKWGIADIDVGPEYTAAVAARAPLRVRRLRFDPVSPRLFAPGARPERHT